MIRARDEKRARALFNAAVSLLTTRISETDFGDIEGYQEISRLEQSVGISVKELPGRDLYVHPVAVSAITPDGQLSRILWGIDYRPDDLRLALVEASEGRLGSLGDRILLLCSGLRS